MGALVGKDDPSRISCALVYIILLLATTGLLQQLDIIAYMSQVSMSIDRFAVAFLDGIDLLNWFFFNDIGHTLNTLSSE